MDSNDRIIVSDSGNDRVVVFDSSGNFLLRFGSPGTSDGQFNGAQMLTVDSNDRIIVPDLTNQDVQVFSYATESSTGGGESDSFRLVNQSYERHIDSGMVKNRTHSAYSNLLLWQEKVATEIFDSSLIQGSDKGFTPAPVSTGIDHRTETLQKLPWR